MATNKHGELQTHFNLEIGTKPDPPKYVELKGVNSNFIDLGIHGPDPKDGQIGSHAMEPNGFRVQYKEKRVSAWDDRDFNLSPGKFILTSNKF